MFDALLTQQFVLLISCSSGSQQFIAVSFPVSSAHCSVIPTVLAFLFLCFSPQVNSLFSSAAPAVPCAMGGHRRYPQMLGSLYLGYLEIYWSHVCRLAPLVTCSFSHQCMSCLGPSLPFECLRNCFPEHFCSLVLGLALVKLEQLIYVCLLYCLLLSHQFSSNYTAVDGSQQEEDNLYCTM